MKKDHYWREPKDAKSNQPSGAWWYANKSGIEIHADADPAVRHVQIKISRAALMEYIKRTSK